MDRNANKIVIVTQKSRLQELLCKYNTKAQAKFYIEHMGADFSDYILEDETYQKALTDEMILRKGAIAAHKGERVLIPINMKDGSILAIGKGNPEWNYSAPHGAGRIMSRTKAKNEINLDEYKQAMKGIYTTSVNENTLDEAPMAYKSLESTIDVIRESVDIIDVMKPIYNFKASE